MNRFQGLVILSLVFHFSYSAVSYGAVPNSTFTFLDYFSIRSVQIREIQESSTLPKTRFQTFTHTEEVALLDLSGAIGDATSTTQGATQLLDTIINFGKKVWAVIEANKPTVNFTSDYANALPFGTTSWEQMGEWKTPQSRLFRVSYTNFLGMTVVDFTFRFIYTYGGNVNGKGLYLTQIAVIPADLRVNMGYTLNVHVSVPSITNVGTSEAPIAGAQVQVNWSVVNWAQLREGSQSYFIRGDGYFEDLSGKLEEESAAKSGEGKRDGEIYGDEIL